MNKCPISVIVISWILIITSVMALIAGTMSLNDPAARELMTGSALSIPMQYGILYSGLLVSVISAVFMLRAANWARMLYIGWVGIELLVLLLTSPAKLMLLPGIVVYGIFVLFLLRPRANEYFANGTVLVR